MATFHINPNSGEPSQCSATKGRCPFATDEDHYGSKEEARVAYEAAMGAGLTPPEVASATTYDFPAHRLPEAIGRIDKANRRAERANIEERFSYRVESYEVRQKDEDGLVKIEERVRLTLDRPSIQHEGWRFAGTMSWDKEAGLITRMVPGEELLARPEAERCDVCETTRHRNDTYIVVKGEEQKQVGSACMERFLGMRPAGLWMMDFEPGADLSDSEARTPWPEQRRDSSEMVALGLAIVEKHGWTSRAQAREVEGLTATADIVEHMLTSSPLTESEREARAALFARAEELEGEAKAVLTYGAEVDGDSEYAVNLRALSTAESVTMRNLPLLLSSIPQKRRRDAKAEEEARRLANPDPSQWVGAPGEKLDSRYVRVVDSRTTSSSYGTSTLLTLLDDQGNRYKTFYSGTFDAEVGKTYEMSSAVVKDHQEWNSVKETMVGRVKFRTVRPDVLPPSTLPDDSPYAQAWTVEENAAANNKAHRDLRSEYKKLAKTNGGWDNSFNIPLDPGLRKKFDEAVRETNKHFDVRYRELVEQDS